jgi:hypothetical protein
MLDRLSTSVAVTRRGAEVSSDSDRRQRVFITVTDPTAGSAGFLAEAMVRLSCSPTVRVDLEALLPTTHPTYDELLPIAEPLISAMTAILEDEASLHNVRSMGITVTPFIDPDEGREEIVITQRVDLDAAAAFTYWDEVGATVEMWARGLTDDQQRYVDAYIAIDVQWSDAEPSPV